MNMLGTKNSWIDKIGIPSNLFWGYIGIVVFMIGDGLEHGWLSPYLVERGLSMEQAGFYSRFTVLPLPLAHGFLVFLFKCGGRERQWLLALFHLLSVLLFLLA